MRLSIAADLRMGIEQKLQPGRPGFHRPADEKNLLLAQVQDCSVQPLELGKSCRRFANVQHGSPQPVSLLSDLNSRFEPIISVSRTFRKYGQTMMGRRQPARDRCEWYKVGHRQRLQ